MSGPLERYELHMSVYNILMDIEEIASDNCLHAEDHTLLTLRNRCSEADSDSIEEADDKYETNKRRCRALDEIRRKLFRITKEIRDERQESEATDDN